MGDWVYVNFNQETFRFPMCTTLSSLETLVNQKLGLKNSKLYPRKLEPGTNFNLLFPLKGGSGGVELSSKDIESRFQSKKNFYLFFTQINQRYLPDIKTIPPEYLTQLLTGQKRALRLLDVRSYYFPESFYRHYLLQPTQLETTCCDFEKFLPSPCTDQQYMVNLLATLDYPAIKKIDCIVTEDLRQEQNLLYLDWS